MVPPESSADEIELWKKTRPSAGDRSPLSPAAGQERRFLHSPARANLLRHLDFAGREVLELGAAGGGLSRFLAAAAARLVVAETEPEQRQLLEERLRDLPQVRVVADPLTLESFFDVAVVVEARGEEAAADFDQRLAWARQLLRPGGWLLVAGSNRLGLDQLSGQPERRSGTYFAGVAGGGADAGGRCRNEWRLHLRSHGFEIREEFLVSPDIWLPGCVMRPQLLEEDRELAVDLFCHLPFADPTFPVFPLLPPSLLAESLARGSLLADFAPGYLWLCGRAGEGARAAAPLLAENEGESTLAWHHAAERRPATTTRFFRRGGELRVAKVALTAAPFLSRLRWHAPPEEVVQRGERWRQRLIRSAYFEDGRFVGELTSLLRQLQAELGERGGVLPGRSFDAILHNALRTESGETRLFDLEWELDGELAGSYWLLRHLLALTQGIDSFGRGIGTRDLAELYQGLCRELGFRAQLDRDVAQEASLQAELGGGDAAELEQALAELLRRPLRGSILPPRQPQQIAAFRLEHDRAASGLEALQAGFAAVGKLAEDLRWMAEKVAEIAQAQTHQEAALRNQQGSLESIDAALRWLASQIVPKT